MVQFYSAKKNSQPRKKLEVIIDALDQFGQGIARYQGKTCFITGGLPGEKAEVRLYEEKRAYAKGRVIRLLTRSPERETPRCPVYEQCGGCQQQHANVTLQHAAKSQMLSRMLSQVNPTAVTVNEIISAEPWHYRRRARLSLRWDDKTHSLAMGFRQQASNQIVEIQHCPVLVESLNQLLVPLKAFLQSLTIARHLGHVELVAADNSVVLTLRHLKPFAEEDKKILTEFAEKYQLSLFLAPETDRLMLHTGEQPWYIIDKIKLYFNPTNFIQVNAAVNQKMVAKALAWLDLKPEDRVLDLFCGMGNFTLPIAQHASSVTGVEGVDALVQQAKENAQINNLTNANFFQHNLELDVAKQVWAKEGFNKVLLDPARAGAEQVMQHVVKLNPEIIVYVSCNPATLARDSQELVAKGYRMQEVVMLDMFPHTGHLESMVLFIRT